MTLSSELYNKLKFLKSFVGVFPCDRIPVLKTLPVSFILNTDTHDKKGEHWVAIYINKDNFGLYFDSYGLRPLNIEFVDYLNKNCKTWTYNHTTIQGINSINCGKYCVLFILLKSIGYSLHEIVYLFSNSFDTNDKIIDIIYSNL